MAFAACAGLSAGAISSKFSDAAQACGGTSSPGIPTGPAIDSAAPQLVATPRSVAVPYLAPRRILQHGRRRAPPNNVLLRVSQHYRIDPLLLGAIVHQESGFRPGAISSKGALGLMQVMPATARGLGLSNPRLMLTDPELSLSTGATYLKQLQGKFGNDVPAVLAAYNAGPGAVKRYGRAVPYKETRGYVSTIMTRYRSARHGTVR